MNTNKNRYFMLQYGPLDIDSHIDTFPALMARRFDLQPHHIDRILDSGSYDGIRTIAKERKLTDHQFNRLRNNKSLDVPTKLSENRNLTISQIDAFVMAKDKFMIGHHPNLHPHHIDKLLNDEKHLVRIDVASRKDLQPHHIENLLKDESSFVRNVLSKNPRYQDYLKAKNE